MLELAAVRPDDVVVVTSAAGGLGTLLLQGVRRAGALAVGLAGGAKADVVRRHGADVVVDYRHPDWADRLRREAPRPTLLLDGVGGAVPRTVHAMLAPGGRTVRFSGDREGYDVAGRGVVDLHGPALAARIPDLEVEALRAATAGERVPFVGTRVPLARAADAHRALETRAAVGKVVLEVVR